jgi:hypothetical protein
MVDMALLSRTVVSPGRPFEEDELIASPLHRTSVRGFRGAEQFRDRWWRPFAAEGSPTRSTPVAFVQVQPLPFEARTEAAVVRDDDDRPRVCRERVLEVLDQVGRDVVRRLVRYEEVRGAGHQARDLKPPSLADGQGGDRDVQVLSRNRPSARSCSPYSPGGPGRPAANAARSGSRVECAGSSCGR